MILEKIGQRLQRERMKKGLTQVRLAEMTNFYVQYISKVERGVRQASIENLVVILNCLDCSADDIFCDVVNKSVFGQANEISVAIEKLPNDEKRRILAALKILTDKDNLY